MQPAKHPLQRDLSDVARRLREDHVLFDRRFDDLRRRAREDDWRGLDEVWGLFVRDIEGHLAFEERDVFPGFAREGQDCRCVVEELAAQHAEIRRLLDSLGLEIQLKEIRAPILEAFTDLMRRHATLENLRIYPWLEREGRLWSSPAAQPSLGDA